MYPRTSGHFYLAVIQAVLLFGAEMWVVTPRIGRLLGLLYHRVDRRLVKMQHWIQADGIWDYPPLEDSLRAVLLEVMVTYISRFHNTAAQ